jgi:hypothetical protein
MSGDEREKISIIDRLEFKKRLAQQPYYSKLKNISKKNCIEFRGVCPWCRQRTGRRVPSAIVKQLADDIRTRLYGDLK